MEKNAFEMELSQYITCSKMCSLPLPSWLVISLICSVIVRPVVSILHLLIMLLHILGKIIPQIALLISNGRLPAISKSRVCLVGRDWVVGRGDVGILLGSARVVFCCFCVLRVRGLLSIGPLAGEKGFRCWVAQREEGLGALEAWLES